MDMWQSIAQSRLTQMEEFEKSLIEMARSEKTAGDLTEALDTLQGPSTSKTPRIDKLLDQTKLAARMGRELATKEAGIASGMLSAVKPLASKALGLAAKHPAGAMGIAGAGLGALGGAATAQPGHRMSGALGGAALGGAAGYGASKLPGGMGQKAMDYTSGAANMGLNRMGMQMKFASIKTGGLGASAVGALAGGAMGAMHNNPAEQQGLMPTHHLRNALLGAAGGAAAGHGAQRLSTMAGGLGKAEGAIAHAAPHPHMGFTPGTASAEAMGHVTDPAALAQRERVRKMYNSTEANRAYQARHMDALKQNLIANPNGPSPRPAAPAGGTMAGKVKAPVDPRGQTGVGGGAPMRDSEMLRQWGAKLAGKAFIKMAMSMSAQAEPGTDGGAQEPDAEPQLLSRPERSSKPAMDLYGSLKHLSPRSMRGLQVAQPGT